MTKASCPLIKITFFLAMPIAAWACQVSDDVDESCDGASDACTEESAPFDAARPEDRTVPDTLAEGAAPLPCGDVPQRGATITAVPYEDQLGDVADFAGGAISPGTYTLAERYVVAPGALGAPLARTLALSKTPKGYAFALRDTTAIGTTGAAGWLETAAGLGALTVTCPTAVPALAVRYHVVSDRRFYMRVGDDLDVYTRSADPDAGPDATSDADASAPGDSSPGSDDAAVSDGHFPPMDASDASADDADASNTCGGPSPGSYPVTDSVTPLGLPLKTMSAPNGLYTLVERLTSQSPVRTRYKQLTIRAGAQVEVTISEAVEGEAPTVLRGTIQPKPGSFHDYGLALTCPTPGWIPFSYQSDTKVLFVSFGTTAWETYWPLQLDPGTGGLDGRGEGGSGGGDMDAGAPLCATVPIAEPSITPTQRAPIDHVYGGGDGNFPDGTYKLVERTAYTSGSAILTPRKSTLVFKAGTYAHRVDEDGGPTEVRSGTIVGKHVWGTLVLGQSCPASREVVLRYVWHESNKALWVFDGLYNDIYRLQ